MALLNGLLDRLLANHQEALLLTPGRPPRYRTGDGETDAAAFELDDGIIAELLHEASPDGLMPEPTAGSRHRFGHRHNGIELAFAAAATPEGWSVSVTRPQPKALSPSGSVETAAADGMNGFPDLEARWALSPGHGDPGAPAPDPAAPDLAAPVSAPREEIAPDPAGATEAAVELVFAAPTRPRAVAVPAASTPQAAAAPAYSAAVAYSAEIATPDGLLGIDELLGAMLKREASDLHLSACQRPRLRLDGRLRPVEEWAAPDSEQLMSGLVGLMPQRNQEEFAATNDTDFAYEIATVGRFRVNVFRERQGVGAVFRHIPFEPPSFEELGLPRVLEALTRLPKGLVLVTGPTGSGKSTTLAALIHLINRSRQDHIITIEDPIEFVHESNQCLVTQREVGPHTGSFHHALRAALREDPDIVLVGEMRDLETMSTAIHTAETGHLVFGTLHTTSAPSTVERVIGQFPGDLQGQIRLMLADSLRAVVSQTLLRKIGGGRVAAFEVLLGTPAVSNLIREGKTFQIASTMQTGKGIGMSTLTDSLFDLVTKGLVDPAEAYSKAVYKEAMAGKFDAAGVRLASDSTSELVA